jgi:hypothetical protein
MIGLNRAALLLLGVTSICSIIRPALQGRPLHESYVQSTETVSESNVKRKAKRVSFTFTRSGGFAGRATRIQATVVLEPNGGAVSAPDRAGYHRSLSAEESAQLSSWLRQSEKKPESKEATGSMAPDSFQYSATIQTGQQARTLDLSTPENTELKKWVETECEKIWDHMIGSQKAAP